MASPGRTLNRFTSGGRGPGAIGALLVVTIAASLVAAYGSRHLLPLFEVCALVAYGVVALLAGVGSCVFALLDRDIVDQTFIGSARRRRSHLSVSSA